MELPDIKRWTLESTKDYAFMDAWSNGEYVLYADHMKQLDHLQATARLILRAQLTQQLGRTPKDSEMDTHWRMWLDAGKSSVEISEESACNQS